VNLYPTVGRALRRWEVQVGLTAALREVARMDGPLVHDQIPRCFVAERQLPASARTQRTLVSVQKTRNTMCYPAEPALTPGMERVMGFEPITASRWIKLLGCVRIQVRCKCEI
jgi:hypothetical protein